MAVTVLPVMTLGDKEYLLSYHLMCLNFKMFTN